MLLSCPCIPESQQYSTQYGRKAATHQTKCKNKKHKHRNVTKLLVIHIYYLKKMPYEAFGNGATEKKVRFCLIL